MLGAFELVAVAPASVSTSVGGGVAAVAAAENGGTAGLVGGRPCRGFGRPAP